MDPALYARSLALCLVGCLLVADTVAQCATQKPGPYLNLRSQELRFAGPDSDCSDLPEVRLGWFGPSDQTNTSAAGLWWAATLAVREANEQGGYHGKPFRLLPRWSENPWGSGVAELARMVYEQRPVAVLGGPDSTATHLAEQVVAKANLTLVSPVATDKTATLAGVPWMFACAPSDSAIASALVAHIQTTRATNRLTLITATDHESRMIATEISRHLSRIGSPPDYRFELAPGMASVEKQVEVMAAGHPGVVLIIAGAADAARILPLLRPRIPHAVFCGTHQLSRSEFLRMAGQNAEGLTVPLLFTPAAGNTRAAHLTEEFLKTHAYPPDYATAFAYDATCLLLEAVRNAGPNRAEVRSAITRLAPWEGVSGRVSFDGTGQNTRRDVALGVVRNGVIIPLNQKPSFTVLNR